MLRGEMLPRAKAGNDHPGVKFASVPAFARQLVLFLGCFCMFAGCSFAATSSPAGHSNLLMLTVLTSA